MNKTYLSLRLTILALFTIVIFGCKKETSDAGLSTQQEDEIATLSARSETEAELVFNDVFDNIMGVNAEVALGGTGVFGRTAFQDGRESGMDSIPQCVTLTITRQNPPDLFPVRIVIDFGGGCPGKDGHMRYGKIITTYTGRLTVAGKSATTVFEGYKMDSIAVQGSWQITNTTAAASNQRQFTIDIADAKLSKPGGSFVQWTSHRVITQVEGNATPDLGIDDVFSIEGSGQGKVQQNNTLYAWKSEITEPLKKRFGCRWISKGVLKVWRETLASNSQWAASLNYGNGTCDYWATLTINGVTKEVRLPH